MLLEELEDPGKNTNPTFNLKKITYKVVTNFYWVIISIVISVLIAKLYLRYQVPVTTITSNILVKTSDPSNTLTISGDPFEGDRTVENEIFILHSYGLIETLTDSLHLNVQLSQVGRIKQIPVDIDGLPIKIRVNPDEATGSKNYVISFNNTGYKLVDKETVFNGSYGKPLAINGDTLEVTLLSDLRSLKYSSYNINWKGKSAVTENYLSRLSVTPAKIGKGIVALTVNDELPERGIRFLNALIKEYDRNTLWYKNKAIRSAIAFLDDRLIIVGSELEQQEDLEGRFRSANKIYEVSDAAQSIMSKLNNLDVQQNTNEYNRLIIDALKAHVEKNRPKRIIS